MTSAEGGCFQGAVVLLACVVWAASCPSVCVCKWKGGKQTVECVNKGLNTIPFEMDPGTQVLDVTGNTLHVLSHEKFKVMGLTNLQRIYLSRCKLSQVDDSAFKGLTNLVELDLSENDLILVPVAALEQVTGLMRLQLSHNPITKIKEGSFRNLMYLTTLEMTGCSVQSMEPRAFQNLDQLEWLKMNDNQLSTIPDNMFFPKSLHGIDLHNNPWNCDCHLQQLRAWLVKYNVPSSIEPKCFSPRRLEERTIKSILPVQFACAPETRPSSLYIDILEGRNVTFECQVTATPIARVYWTFNGMSLENSTFIYDESTSIYIYEEIATDASRISYLRIEWITEAHDGVFRCIAENIAGKASANFTLRISRPTREPMPQGLVVDYIVYISGAAITILSLLIVLMCVLIIRCCRRRIKRAEKPSNSHVVIAGNGRLKDGAGQTNNMPRNMQMGTMTPKMNGICSDHPTVSVIDSSPYRSAEPVGGTKRDPDLISDAVEDRVKPAKKHVSIFGVEEMDEAGIRTTRQLEDIMEEYEDGQEQSYDQMMMEQNGMSSRNNQFSNIHRRRIPECMNPYPLTEIPPPDTMNTRFYHVDGYPLDYGLPMDPQWREDIPATYNGHSEQIPMFVSIRSPSTRQEEILQHDQKYPEEYLIKNPGDMHMYPDGRYQQVYGLVSDGYANIGNMIPVNGTCDFCPSMPHLRYTGDQHGRINGDGCSFEHLQPQPCTSACFSNHPRQFYDMSMSESYTQPLDSNPPPPKGWGDPSLESPSAGLCEYSHAQSSAALNTSSDGPRLPGTQV